jgi:16S rRNA (uracil1498-N3)-methyltransferase
MSTLIRLFVPEPLSSGAVIAANQGQAHYLAHVMRRVAGDSVLLFNGRDGEWQAGIDRIARDRAMLRLEFQTRTQGAEPDLWLAFAPLRRDATNLVVEKATELGASAILPVITARSQTSRINLDRLTLIAREAAEQSERLTVPVIAAPVTLNELMKRWPVERRLAVAAERRGAAALHPPAGGLLIGPEGGFTAAELDGLAEYPFVTLVSLGARILRAETAAIAGLARLLAVPPSK